jgi:hypothetical protein
MRSSSRTPKTACRITSSVTACMRGRSSISLPTGQPAKGLPDGYHDPLVVQDLRLRYPTPFPVLEPLVAHGVAAHVEGHTASGTPRKAVVPRLPGLPRLVAGASSQTRAGVGQDLPWRQPRFLAAGVRERHPHGRPRARNHPPDSPPGGARRVGSRLADEEFPRPGQRHAGDHEDQPECKEGEVPAERPAEVVAHVMDAD